MDRFPYLYLHYFCGSRTPADQMRPEMKRTRNARAAGSVQCEWPSVRKRGFPANGHERRFMSQGHGERGGWGDFDFDFGRRVLSYVASGTFTHTLVLSLQPRHLCLAC